MWKKNVCSSCLSGVASSNLYKSMKKQCVSVSGSTVYHSSNENMQMFWCLLCSIHFGTLKYVYTYYIDMFIVSELHHYVTEWNVSNAKCVCVCACATHKGVHSKTLPAPNSKFLFSTTLVNENLVSQVHKKRKLKKLPFWVTILIPYIPKTPGVADCGSMPGHKTKRGHFKHPGPWQWLVCGYGSQKRSCNSGSPTVHEHSSGSWKGHPKFGTVFLI